MEEIRRKTTFRDFIKELGSWEILNLYKRDGKVCRYPPNDRIKKLGTNFWEDASSFGREYDFSKEFFENFQALQDTIPLQYTLQFGTNENCEYMDGVFLGKNVYLSFIVGFHAENVLYTAFSYVNVTNVINSFMVAKNSSEIANSIGVSESYKVFYSKNISNSSNIWFSTNLIGCEECIGCDSLENQKHHINNVAYSPSEYELKKKEILGDKASFDSIWGHIQKRTIQNFASENITGKGIAKSSDIENGVWINNMHQARNVAIGNGDKGARDLVDCIDVGVNANHFYGVMGAGGSNAHHVYLSMQIDDCSDIYYSAYMQNCHHCIGCMGLKNASYCILNKEYPKEIWEELTQKILQSMESSDTLGKYFPPSMNPFYFNDTLAYLMDSSFTKEEVEKDGYLWRDEPIRADIPADIKIIKNSELGDFQGFDAEGKWQINPSILDVAIADQKGNHYRIVKMEYDFLMKHELPLPTEHWLDRIKKGFSV